MIDFDASAHLKSLRDIPDENIDLGLTALCLSGAVSGQSLQKYINHLKQIDDSVCARYGALIARGGAADIRTKLAALKHILSDELDYRLDAPEAEVLESNDLARVMDRRLGNSTAISILYLTAAHRLGWQIEAIDFPDYLFCRMAEGAERLIIDAPRQCRLMAAPDLRATLKQVKGPKAELSAAYFEPISRRQILIRLQNPIKLRLIEMGDYARAVAVVEAMRMIDPAEYRLDLDAGVLYAKINRPQPAIAALERYIHQAPNPRDRQEALMLLHELKG